MEWLYWLHGIGVGKDSLRWRLAFCPTGERRRGFAGRGFIDILMALKVVFIFDHIRFCFIGEIVENSIEHLCIILECYALFSYNICKTCHKICCTLIQDAATSHIQRSPDSREHNIVHCY